MNQNLVVKKKQTSVQKLVLVGMFAAVLAVLSQLSIPMPTGVPVTLQTFAVALTGYVLGWKLGTVAVLVYILIGAAGAPVFANFSGGPGALVGMSGGFLWGFIVMVFLCGFGAEQKNKLVLSGMSFAGLAACHLLGIWQFMAVTEMKFIPAALAASVPYLAKDAVSLIAAYLVAKTIRKALNAAGIGGSLR